MANYKMEIAIESDPLRMSSVMYLLYTGALLNLIRGDLLSGECTIPD